MSLDLPRRRLLSAGAALGGLTLAGCNRVAHAPGVLKVLDLAETLDLKVQRLLLSPGQRAPEYKPDQISKNFKVNGTSAPDTDDYKQLQDSGFATYRLSIDGLVLRPLQLTLAQLKGLPAVTQITRHDCVEGWSAIGQWTGVPLGLLLRTVGVRPEGRYVVFHTADDLDQSTDGSGRFYSSIDLVDAFHPQTLLAYGMNGQDLTVGHGAPLRLRLGRQLGYKMAKYVTRIQVVDSFARLGQGNGGYWEDRGYAWYAGI